MTLLMLDRLNVPIPKRLRTRPRDPRGFPVPFIVLIDKSGQPQFTINDSTRVRACMTKHLCALCGKRFEASGMWFIGGSRCFMHEHGAFIDPPSHYECAEYALRVCPFLAAPSYSKRIDDRKLKPENMLDDMTLARIDYMLPSQPEWFGLGCTQSYRPLYQGPAQSTVLIVERWNYVEFWKNGVTVNAPEHLVDDQPMVRF